MSEEKKEMNDTLKQCLVERLCRLIHNLDKRFIECLVDEGWEEFKKEFPDLVNYTNGQVAWDIGVAYAGKNFGLLFTPRYGNDLEKNKKMFPPGTEHCLPGSWRTEQTIKKERELK